MQKRNARSLRDALASAHPAVFSIYCIAAAFGTYFCMYAFRKPFTAGTFEDDQLWNIPYKTVLIGSQVLGYTLSKFVGIKIISEMRANRRAAGIVVLIAMAQIALLLFGLTPPPYNFVFLFFNGLPLGMVFGLVLSFLEGRRMTEALSAGLCASFIMSSGVVKSIGRYMIEVGGVSEFWMPFLTGLLFVPPLLVFVWLLSQIPPPSPIDIKLRSERSPMTSLDRRQFFRRYAGGLIFLLLTYVLLTVIRSVRDDFAVEIWTGLGEQGKPAVFAQSETLVMFGVVIINGAVIVLRKNLTAWLTSALTMILGFLLASGAVLAHDSGRLAAFPFMVLVGLGLYVPYVAFHTTVFERLIALTRDKGNIGYLMYLADAVGYLGYVAVMVFRNFGDTNVDYLPFFVRTTLVMSLASTLLTVLAALYFYRRFGGTDGSAPNFTAGSGDIS